MAKKKLLNTYYIVFLGVLFVIFFGLFSNSYGMTDDELQYFLDETKLHVENFTTNTSARDNCLSYLNSVNLLQKISANNIDISKYNVFLFGFTNIGTPIVWLYNTDNLEVFVNTSQLNIDKKNSNVLFEALYSSNIYREYLPSRTYLANSSDFFYSSNESGQSIVSSINLYTYNTQNISDKIFVLPEYSTNSIELISSSGRKFTFNDFNQLRVNISGDWSIDDFTFYVQRYINNDWENFTEPWDYTRIIDYENPYYIRWNNLNYFPAGIYRYCADYGSLGTDLYYSDSFDITSSIIDNSGTGTVGEQNININIDTGQTVDSIKDYLGQEPENANSDIEDSVNNIKDNLENELANSEIISTLQLAEKGFLDLLKEPEKDFKIEWNNIFYENTVLIPAGSINFSKMCRDDQSLGRVKQYINIIVSFGLAYGIIKYLYNLLLATLGIDNQLLYEQPEETTIFTADTNSGTVTYRTRSKNGNTVIHKGSMKGKESRR